MVPQECLYSVGINFFALTLKDEIFHITKISSRKGVGLGSRPLVFVSNCFSAWGCAFVIVLTLTHGFEAR